MYVEFNTNCRSHRLVINNKKKLWVILCKQDAYLHDLGLLFWHIQL